MPISARQARGRRTQVVIAAWLQSHGWPGVRSPVGAEAGQDIKGETGMHSIEVKARADFDPRAWLKQAKKNAKPGQRPCALIRMNGQGEGDVGEYLVIRRLEDDELNRMRDGDPSSLAALAERRANAVDPGDEMRCNRCGEAGHSALDGYYHH